MSESLIDRFISLMAHFDMTPNAFAKKSTLDPSHWNKMLAGEANITAKTLEKISCAFPSINMNWVKTGQGAMIKDMELPPKGGKALSQLESPNTIPLLPIEAVAGGLAGISDGVMLRDCRQIIPPVSGADWAIQISGDSMEPELSSGTILYIKRINNKAFIPWGNTMVVDTENGVVVKKLYPVDNQSEYIEARSVNPNYPPYLIETSSIYGIYRILGTSFVNSTF